MKTAIICAFTFTLLVLTCSAGNAQQAWLVPPLEGNRTAVQKILNDELPMPGVGIEKSRKQIQARLQYAQDNKWLTEEQIAEFRSDLKTVMDTCESQKDAEGNVTYAAKVAAAKQLFRLNGRFEEVALQSEKQRIKLAKSNKTEM